MLVGVSRLNILISVFLDHKLITPTVARPVRVILQ